MLPEVMLGTNCLHAAIASRSYIKDAMDHLAFTHKLETQAGVDMGCVTVKYTFYSWRTRFSGSPVVAVTLAAVLPRSESTMSNFTRSPSFRKRKPLDSIAVWCTKTAIEGKQSSGQAVKLQHDIDRQSKA